MNTFIPYLLPLSIALFAAGAVGSLLFGVHDRGANRWAHACAFAGAIIAFAFGVGVEASGTIVAWRHAIGVPGLFFSIRVDALSAFFIIVISAIAAVSSLYGVGYMKHFYSHYRVSGFGIFYNIFIASLLLVVSASDTLLFLVVWECMSVASFFLVIFEHRDENNMRAGYVYFIMTHIGTACILTALLLLYGAVGSFEFSVMKANAALLSPFVKNAVFVLAVIGFGTKAGMIPMHVWLPKAHPAAPSHVSAIMSSVMIKTGIYMMIRLFIDVIGSFPAWWGIAILLLGAISCFLGVLYALTEHDLKRLLAYHSIENIGIILLGVGAGMLFLATGNHVMAVTGFAAALFHIMNHAIFKGLLFLGAGSVISATHTRNIEEYGGLLKRMPATGLFFLIGAIAISALPPFNGFASEWLTYQALFGGIVAAGLVTKTVCIAAVASLAFSGGLAAACFVKAFGATFLARPRSHESAHARESSIWMTVPMGLLALACLLLGLGSRWIVPALSRIAERVMGGTDVESVVSFSLNVPLVFVALSVAIVVTACVVTLVCRKRSVTYDRTWGCGFPVATPQNEITATGFARSLMMIFRSLVRPVRSIQMVTDARSPYVPTSITVHLSVSDVYHAYLYNPLHTLFARTAHRVKRIQHGNVNAYVLYIGVTLLVLLAWATR